MKRITQTAKLAKLANPIIVALPNTVTAQELFNSCTADGGKARDHSAMVKALETLANFEIGQQPA